MYLKMESKSFAHYSMEIFFTFQHRKHFPRCRWEVIKELSHFCWKYIVIQWRLWWDERWMNIWGCVNCQKISIVMKIFDEKKKKKDNLHLFQWTINDERSIFHLTKDKSKTESVENLSNVNTFSYSLNSFVFYSSHLLVHKWFSSVDVTSMDRDKDKWFILHRWTMTGREIQQQNGMFADRKECREKCQSLSICTMSGALFLM